MRALIQRVAEASVEVEGREVARIGPGMLLLVGIEKPDTVDDADYVARKTSALRIFADETGKMNRSIAETGGEVLVVSQFTLCAEVRKGNRPGFDRAMPPEPAVQLFRRFVAALGSCLPKPPRTGVFGAHMKVRLVNDGPVTILLESRSPAAAC